MCRTSAREDLNSRDPSQVVGRTWIVNVIIHCFQSIHLLPQFSRALTCKPILAMRAMLTAHDRMECMRAMT